MANTTFVDLNTVITAAWANDVNDNVYEAVSGTAGTVNRTVQQKFTETVSIKDFGAIGDGTTDDTVAIQAAISLVTGNLFFPPGTYKISNTLSWTKSNLNLIGAGQGSTTLSFTHATNDLIVVGDGVANPNNCSISYLTITSSVTKTSGAAIRFRNGHNLKISNVRFDSNMYRSIQLDGGAQQFLYYIDHFEINSGTVGIIVGEDGTLVQDLWIDTGICFGCTDSGILLRHVSGFYFRALDLLGCGSGLTTFPDTGKNVVAGFCDTVLADTCNSHGYKILTNGGLVSELMLSAAWASSCGVTDNGHGMYFDVGSGSIKGISIDSPSCTNNKGAGILINSGEDITISNPQVFANSTQGSAVRSGIEIAAGVSQWSIIGGSCGAGGLFGTNNQQYGIKVFSGTSDLYNIESVNVLGNVTGGIFDGGSGTNKHISHNIGYRTTYRGAGAITTGNSSVVINHGLDATPAQTDFVISPTVDINAAGIARIWVSAATATTFTVTANTAATANLFFAWDARTKGA